MSQLQIPYLDPILKPRYFSSGFIHLRQNKIGRYNKQPGKKCYFECTFKRTKRQQKFNWIDQEHDL